MFAAERLDAEYAAHAKFSWLGELRRKHAFVPLGTLLRSVGSGHTPLKHDVSQGEVGFVTVECVDSLTLHESRLKRITREQYDSEFRDKRVTAGSVVCTIKRRICKAYPFLEKPSSPLAINQDVALLVPNGEVKPAYLAAYLNCAVGQRFADRQKTEQMNPYISVDNLRTLPVCLLSPQFQDLITDVFKSAEAAKAHSATLHAQAERTLLAELGLLDWQPPQPLSYERKASEAFGNNRLDAEHFRPKYDALFALLKTNGDIRLGDHLREPIRRGISPDYVEDGDTLVVNSKHIGKVQVELEDNRRTSRSLLEIQAAETGDDTEAAAKRGDIRRGDVLLNSTGVITIGRCQCMLENVPAVADNHVAIIRPQQSLDPVYLACFLNALPGQMQTERGWTGSSGQIELRPETIADYRIWDAPPEVQQRTRSHVEQAHAARRRAKQLLDSAKRAVEIAIEESEATAIKFLEAHDASE